MKRKKHCGNFKPNFGPLLRCFPLANNTWSCVTSSVSNEINGWNRDEVEWSDPLKTRHRTNLIFFSSHFLSFFFLSSDVQTQPVRGSNSQHMEAQRLPATQSGLHYCAHTGIIKEADQRADYSSTAELQDFLFCLFFFLSLSFYVILYFSLLSFARSVFTLSDQVLASHPPTPHPPDTARSLL